MSPARKATKKKGPKKPASPPVEWACKEHRVLKGGECILCRDQVALFDVPQQAKVRRAGG